MPKSKKRKTTTYQLVQARNRRAAARERNHGALLEVYAAADPDRQDYPPYIYLELKKEQPPGKHLRLVSRVARFIPTRTVKPKQKYTDLRGRVYEGQPDGSLRKVGIERRAA